MKKFLSKIEAREVALVAGVGLITAGAAEIYAPLGFLAPGVLVLAVALIGLPKR